MALITRELEVFGITLEWNGDRNVIAIQDGEIIDMEPCGPEPLSAGRAMARMENDFCFDQEMENDS